jgi:DNA-directed RNA polymerase subunit M/transcription elongation factor TFIIS
MRVNEFCPECGRLLVHSRNFKGDVFNCPECGKMYFIDGNKIAELTPEDRAKLFTGKK